MCSWEDLQNKLTQYVKYFCDDSQGSEQFQFVKRSMALVRLDLLYEVVKSLKDLSPAQEVYVKWLPLVQLIDRLIHLGYIDTSEALQMDDMTRSVTQFLMRELTPDTLKSNTTELTKKVKDEWSSAAWSVWITTFCNDEALSEDQWFKIRQHVESLVNTTVSTRDVMLRKSLPEQASHRARMELRLIQVGVACAMLTHVLERYKEDLDGRHLEEILNSFVKLLASSTQQSPNISLVFQLLDIARARRLLEKKDDDAARTILNLHSATTSQSMVHQLNELERQILNSWVRET